MTELPKYRYDCDSHYEPTTEGVKTILDEYFANKGWLYPVFENHPQYKGNGQIVFSSDYHRKVNKVGVQQFCDWCTDVLLGIYERKAPTVMGLTYGKLCQYYRKLDNICDYMACLNQYEIGQSKVDCRVNGMTLHEMAEERARIYSLKAELSKEVREICTDGLSGYIAIEDIPTFRILLTIFSYISDNIRAL